MPSPKQWDQWNDVHQNPEQLKRQKSACKSEVSPVSIDFDDCSGVFHGSKTDYSTDLNECTCVDFARRMLPCKHMYRLAYELHLFQLPDTVKSNPSISSLLRIDDVMPIITSSLNEDEMVKYALLCYRSFHNESETFKFPIDFADKLIDLNLAEDHTSVESLLNELKADEVRSLLPPDTPRPKNKALAIQLLLPTITVDQVAAIRGYKYIRLHSTLMHLALSIHKRIRMIYPTGNYRLDVLSFQINL